MIKNKLLSHPCIAAIAISFTFLFLFSPDSYTHDLYGHYDSAWFFTCGKAWMNGMTPYVDFADSKGPLLWLIYGIGYLISPRTYIGVFWLSVMLYTCILYFIFRTTRIFLDDVKSSMAVMLMMMAAFFCPWYHTEIRAEDWCTFFIVMALYRICYTLFASNGMNSKEIERTCFVLGLCMAGTLLIKFNSTLMLGTTALYLLYALIREKKNILSSFFWLITGFTILALPFVLHMIIVGNIGAFIQEYFLTTIQTVQSYNGLSTYIHEWLFLTYDTHYVVLFLGGLIGAWMISRSVEKDRYFFSISFLGFYAIAIHHSSFLHWHYLSACIFFVIWICIYIAKNVRGKSLWLTVSFIVGYSFFANIFSWGYVSHTWFWAGCEERKSYYEASSYISQIENPMLLFFFTLDNSLGVYSHCLPATKYWALQMGATKEMKNDQNMAVKMRKADFIITDDHLLPLEYSDSLFRTHGFHKVYSYSLDKLTYQLYTKHDLKDHRSRLHISSIDILLKKNNINK